MAIIGEGTGPPRDVPAEIFRAAAEAYLACERLDMQSLARRVGVGRATLYRRAWQPGADPGRGDLVARPADAGLET